MSSALYRRWRSQTFSELIGQDHVVRTLQAAIGEGKVSHAYLFSGPRGTGKTSTARILAKALNCEHGPAPEPCNTCDTCLAITEGSSLDVIEIDAASHGGVDDVRDLRDSAVLAPASARRKIYIVDEAHMVSTQGWNAFLKTVEEPPPHVVFVFATTEPQKVLPTILSRCQRFEFRRISSSALVDHLSRICDAEGVMFEVAALQMIARAAEGGARDALSTLDQLASAGPVTVADASRLLGVTNTDALFALADAIVDARAGEAVDLVAQLVEEGHDLRVFARGLLEHLRGLLLSIQLEKPEQVLDVNDETLARYRSQADRTEPPVLYHAMRAITDALNDMRQHVPPRLALEMALLRVTMPQLEESAVAAISRISRLERVLSMGGPAATDETASATVTSPAAAAPAPVAAPTEAPVEAPIRSKAPLKKTTTQEATQASADAPTDLASADARLDEESLRRSWSSVLEAVKVRSRVVHSQLQGAHLVGVNDRTIHLEHPNEFLAEALSSGKASAEIIAAVFATLGARVRIRATVRAGAAADEPLDARDLDRQTVVADAFDPIDVFKQGFGDDLVVEE